VTSQERVTFVVAAMGILGTLAATYLGQIGEGRRAERAQRVEAQRRQLDRQDALEKERREAIRADYREILRFLARTRSFVLEMRARLLDLEEWSAHASSDAREVEDLEARAEMLRRSFLNELPGPQSLVGVWASDELVALFDEIEDFGPTIKAGMSVALHFKVEGKRYAVATEEVVQKLDHLLTLLNEARTALRSEQQPS
jgi:hypothetical protein